MIYKTLADMDFSSMLFESKAQTQSGQQLLDHYQAFVMANPVTCQLINNFIKEARQCLYDNGVKEVFEKVTNVVNNNKYSWMLASVCESINNSKAGYNYLNLNASKQVEKLLEMEEKDVVNYIKAGALKNVMFVEGFRNIVRNVQCDRPIVEMAEEYTNIHPVSLIENINDSIYFTAFGNLYKINENGNPILSKEWTSVSESFRMVNDMISKNIVVFENETAIMTTPNYTYTISEAGKCVRKDQNDKELELTVEQLREQNKLYVSTLATPQKRNQMSYMLEGFARVCENFDNIAVLDNVHFISTRNDQFAIIEGKTETSAWSINSNHNAKWSITNNIYEVCNIIKNKTNVDLTGNFKEKIQEAIDNMEEAERKNIQESLQVDDLKSRRERIETLTEKYKNDPTRLAVLAKISAELANI